MTLAEALSRQPPVRTLPAARSLIREKLLEAKAPLVVADDDPTGTQTVHDVPVYMGWDRQILREALEAADPLFYVSTNSRALSTEAARDLGCELGSNLNAAARAAGVSVALCSRSDSTPRGHYPIEVEAMSEALGTNLDGVASACVNSLPLATPVRGRREVFVHVVRPKGSYTSTTALHSAIDNRRSFCYIQM